MDSATLYIIISTAALAIVAVLVAFVFRRRAEKKLSPLAGFAFAFVLVGILFGENRIIGYSLMGIGVILSVVDIFIKMKSE